MQHYHPDHDHTPDGHHVEPEYEGSVEDHPLWQRDNVILTSVGIDIGSAGTQILFSRIHLRRQAVDLSSRYLIVDRETLFESQVSLTPYQDDELIDAHKLGQIVDHAYDQAQLNPDKIDTGVVILTGEALRRKNAERIARILSEKCGDLVCATAGHHMEATLAAHGSGALQLSFDRKERVLNIDIGGGTTKLSVVENGRILSTAAVHIGGRLLATDDNGRIQRLEPAGRAHAARAGYEWNVGDKIKASEIDIVAELMADNLAAIVTASDTAVQSLYLTDPISQLDRIDSVVFSGGVAEFVYHREKRDFGDFGKSLGHAIRRKLDDGSLPWELLTDSQGIRSTVLGCSEFTAQLSGNTGYISNPEALLPRRNVTVIRPVFDFSDDFDSEGLAAAISRHMLMFEVDNVEKNVVLALHWRGAPSYSRIKKLALGLQQAMSDRIERGLPIYIILDADIALNLGEILHNELAVSCDILVLDGLALWDFDSVDLGKLRQPSRTVPVTIKSLVFGDVTADDSKGKRVHHLSHVTSNDLSSV